MMNSYDVIQGRSDIYVKDDNNGDGDDKDNDGHAILARHVWGEVAHSGR